ncbi:hypothetical protein [Nocardia arthritidis]|uniref:Uncharacterized protein n=1 Tax=Nocardia arthritidis TaxID=228602 RepID=A0A6G9YJ42_9NOCA|nr:hypothetical protein [Nocardia arthritidis]QIS13056.1 hypothetical protein F5544_26010 [Nocardia arthritidis]
MKRIGIGILAAGAVLFAAGLGATPATAAPGLPLERATGDTTPSPHARPVVGGTGTGSGEVLDSLSGGGVLFGCLLNPKPWCYSG